MLSLMSEQILNWLSFTEENVFVYIDFGFVAYKNILAFASSENWPI